MLSFLFKKKETTAQEQTQIPKEEFEEISLIGNYFYALCGITFENQPSILQSKTKSFCRAHQINSYKKLLERVENDPQMRQEFINYLTTNESFFFREFAQIESLVQKIKSESGSTKILCAPCANGEESYSVAIALIEAGVSKERFKIYGIDINSDAIENARRGIYRQRSIKYIPEPLIKRYFTCQNERYVLSEEIKELVELRAWNIFDEAFLKWERFDYILSRNMLIYFDHPTKMRAKRILESLLIDPSKEVLFGHADLL
ncbi:MAG: protein-glutamate O-methyltransferase CheR [Epsilonproteobacteria bacterium]|nr:protein-glutamate O-methyltransferase CheR [Campylobacterota bacterium]